MLFVDGLNGKTRYSAVSLALYTHTYTLTGADTLDSVKRTCGGAAVGEVGLPNKTTVSPLRTDCTLANPTLGKIIEGGPGAAAVVAMMCLKEEERERDG